MEPALEIRGVCKTYKNSGRIALDDVSFDIYAGEIIGLLGVNGAGKTTLSSIIATVHPATAGDLVWRGCSIYTCLIEYRRAIGFCPQKPNLDNQLTVEENIYFACLYHLLSASQAKKRVAELLEQFGLAPYAHFKVKHLSGGYKQRLLIARALVNEPALVILDEPTVGLDPHVRRQLWDHIRDCKKRGATVILTTHYLDEAEALSDRVCILDRGRIRLIDTPENIMATYNKSRLEDVFVQLAQEDRDEQNNS